MESLEIGKVYKKKSLEKEFGKFEILFDEDHARVNGNAIFVVKDFVHCCGVRELGSFVNRINIEVSKKVMKEWMKNGAEEGTAYVATATEDSEFQTVLEHFPDWKKVESFVNSRSDNEVSIYIFVK